MDNLGIPQHALVLIRHGETAWNQEGRIQGREDIPLAGTGRRQAWKLRMDLLYGVQWDQVYSSPLQRCMQTASLALPQHQAQIDANLIERDWGILEGVCVADSHLVLKERGLHYDEAAGQVPDGIETTEAMVDRGAQFIEVLGPYPGRVLAFTHGAFARSFSFHLLGLPPRLYRRSSLGNCRAIVWNLREPHALTAWNI